MHKIISTNNAPKAIGAYSQAILAGNMLFISGQLGIYPETNQLAEGIVNETRQALSNILNILKAAEMDKSNLVKITLYINDLEDFSTVNKIYEEMLSPVKPARVTIEVNDLPKSASIEIDAIAIK
ncbi:reactive intermediate/imine deaminase [candidate division WOR-3 bacterium]|nr:reactive intermediate/imine deaminase [candidate division WOR-3 bacterium]